MNLEKLKEGMVVKNYKKLCELLEVEEKGNGKSKILHHEEFQRYFTYEKEKQKYIVTGIYEEPLEKIDNRSLGNNTKEFSQIHIPIEHHKSKGIYIVRETNGNKIYIGSTTTGFKRRFLQHIRKDDIHFTYEILNNKQGIFESLEIMNDSSEQEIRNREDYYIDKYKKDKKYITMNKTGAWSYKIKKKKDIYKIIKVEIDRYDEVIQMLDNENIKYKNRCIFN